MKILVCVPLIPYPAADGLRVRIFNLYRELTRNGHEVHFFCLSRMSPSPEQQAGLSEAGFELTVSLKPMRSHEQKVAAYTKLLVRGIPAEFMLSWEDVIFRDLASLQAGRDFDVVIAEHLFMARYILGLDCPRVLQEHNVEGELMMAIAGRHKLPGRWGKQLSARRVGRYERKLLRKMQGIIAVTRLDADAISRLAPGVSVKVVENGVGCADYAGTAAAGGEPGGRLMFVGLLSYPANIEAVEWFAGKVLPLVREKYQDTTLTVIGSDPVQRVLDLDDGAAVNVAGFVEDVQPYYRESSIQVVPLLIGGGSRLKILESFAAGTPVVSTSKGAEGLEVEDGRHLLIADAPEEFAAAVIRLREDAELYGRLRENALALAQEKYDWPVLAAKFEAALVEAAGKTRARG
ncbi:MAG: glycosyltransferase family 4 protein [Thermoleophilia bacterium]